MIKECKVLSYNKYLNILVFQFEDKQIQTTAEIDEKCKVVYVKHKDDKYEIVTKSEYERFTRGQKKKEIISDKKIVNGGL